MFGSIVVHPDISFGDQPLGCFNTGVREVVKGVKNGTTNRKASGTKGRGFSVEISQVMVVLETGMGWSWSFKCVDSIRVIAKFGQVVIGMLNRRHSIKIDGGHERSESGDV